MSKKDILEQISFGKRVAEEETIELSKYFVRTDQWRKLRSGEVDIVYGPKGSGKSALYALLYQEESTLFDQGVLVVAAENTRGTPVFRDIAIDPPPTQQEFVGLWKIYLLSLVGRKFRDYDLTHERARVILRFLEDARVLDRELSLQGVLSRAIEYAKRIFRPEAIEGGVELDRATGLPTGVTAKIIFSEPTAAQRQAGLRSVDQLFADANEALEASNLNIWLLLDRLDVAFAETSDLEKNALRALFQVYLDLRSIQRISLKIFLRSDIWDRITKEGFREASHITRHLTITWDPPALLNLIVRRLLSNSPVISYYRVTTDEILADFDKQKDLYYRSFPEQVDLGPNKPVTFDWMLSRTRDGTGLSAPREIIHLLNSIRDTQIRKLETGDDEPPDENLFSRPAIKEALYEVSQVRLTQTLYAEHANLRPYIEAMRGERTQQTASTLAALWRVSEDQALAIASQLVEVGFYERRGSRESVSFWVPFLYRDALELVQGTAEEQ